MVAQKSLSLHFHIPYDAIYIETVTKPYEYIIYVNRSSTLKSLTFFIKSSAEMVGCSFNL